MTIPFPRVLPRMFVPYTGFIFVLAMLFGGGTQQGFWSDAVVQLASLPLLAWALFRLTQIQLSASARWGVALLCAILELPLIQLIPLPPAAWAILPGRTSIRSAYEVAGIAPPWLPISLDPNATWRALLSLLPAAAIFLAMLSMTHKARRLLVVLMLAVACISIVVDMLQMIGGPESGLRFYAITNADRAVGFLANSNHNAAFLYAAIPFAAASAIVLANGQRHRWVLGVVAMALLLAALVMALALTRSRGGMALGVLAGLLCVALVWRLGRGKSRRKLLLIVGSGNLIAALVAFQFGFVSLSQRVEDAELIQDLRWSVAAVTARAAVANLPFGSGFGTFIPEYRMFAPRELERVNYVNRAHDDWLEVWLEGGVLAMAVAIAFLVWFGWVSLRVWRTRSSAGHEIDGLLPRAGSIVIVLLMLHSIVDYPLRTTAIMTVFSLCCGLLVPPVREEAPGHHVT